MMYTLIAVYIGGRVIDFVQEGAYSAKGAFIISNEADAIADAITKNMGRGVTIINGRGHFTKENRDVLYCVVARNEIVRLKSIIENSDPHAFVSIVEVREAAGQGFTLDDQKQPLH